MDDEKEDLNMPLVSHQTDMTYVPADSWSLPHKRTRSCIPDNNRCPVQPLVAQSGDNLYLDFDRVKSDLDEMNDPCKEGDLLNTDIDTRNGPTGDWTYVPTNPWDVPDKKTPKCLSTQARCLNHSYLDRGTSIQNVFDYTKVGSVLPDFNFIERE